MLRFKKFGTILVGQLDLTWPRHGARARYAWVCVEVDLSKLLLGRYVIEYRTYFVEYESLEMVCFSCGLYGHLIDNFPENHSHEKAHTKPKPLTPKESFASEEANDGAEW
ncbi:hypothetical protein LINPERHAP1_LOCUS6118 [Linum perenne]